MILTIYTATTMIVLAYLLGSIPSAVWIGKKYYGIDIREHGSKNAGTTNMLRVLGRRAAGPVFALDFLKGFVAVTVIELMQYDDLIGHNDIINLKIGAVVAAVLGHIFPIFAGFRGGKGVSTTCAAIILAWPAAGVVSCLAGLAAVVFGGYLCWGAVTITGVYELFCLLQLLVVPTASLSAYVSAWTMLGCATVLFALMAAAHAPAIRGIKEGGTPRASLSQKVLGRRHS